MSGQSSKAKHPNHPAEEDDVVSGIMPLPTCLGRTTGELPMGPGAHRISAPFRNHNHFNQSAETIAVPRPVSREEEEEEEATEYNNNNVVGLVMAEPVDALPEAAWVEQEGGGGGFRKPTKQNGTRRNKHCGCYPLMILCCTIMAAWLADTLGGIVLAGQDPAMMRVRQSLEEFFGKDYFDSEPKEKALRWIVYEDPLKDLAVKQDLQEDKTTGLIQRFSLVAFYFQTSSRQPWTYCGPPVGKQSDVCAYKDFFAKNEMIWRGWRWLSATHECQWAGVYCDDSSKTVTKLRFAQTNTTGPIPSELSKLSNLRHLRLVHSNFSGTLPSWINQLPSIEKLQLVHNSFTGTIPSTIFSIRSLSELSLASNLLSGQLPSEIGLFRGRFLSLQENSLFGPIPNQTYQLSNLEYLILHQNKLTGTISTLVGQLSELQELTLNHCDLHGAIPKEVGLKSLRNLNLTAMNLEGRIPEELYNSKSLKFLDISNTDIGGTISSRIGQLAELIRFHMVNTGISGTIPQQLSRLSKLRLFRANGNPKLSGSIPSEFCTNKFQHYETVVDCSPSSSTGVPAVMCPKGCCSSCCDVDTKRCSYH